ncbi:hypothetical protein HYX70_01415 [Candidatus Saccharibacteria bacterium]|nr:hypothetical protein [Candidatus Saccharibacteria bacterium]
MQASMRGAGKKDELDELQEDILVSLAEEGPIEGELNAAEALAKRMGVPVSRLSAKIRQLEHAGQVATIHNGGNLVANVYVTADGCRACGLSAKKANVPTNFDELKDELAALELPKRRSGTSVSTSLRSGTLGCEPSGRNGKPPNKRRAKKPVPTLSPPATASAPGVKLPSKRVVQFGLGDLTEMDRRILCELDNNGQVESNNARLDLIGRADRIAYAENEEVRLRLKRLAAAGYIEQVQVIRITPIGQLALEADG